MSPRRTVEGVIRDRPRPYVDFNEMPEGDLVLLSREDSKLDSERHLVHLHEGLKVYVYMTDLDEHGRPDNLLAEGVVERNTRKDWSQHVTWCCRIDRNFSIRHESDLKGQST